MLPGGARPSVGEERGDARLSGQGALAGGAGRALRGSRPVWRTECGREWASVLAGPSGEVAKRAERKSLGFAGWAAAALGPSWVGLLWVLLG